MLDVSAQVALSRTAVLAFQTVRFRVDVDPVTSLVLIHAIGRLAHRSHDFVSVDEGVVALPGVRREIANV